MGTVDLHTGTGSIGDTADLDAGAGTDEHGVVAIGLPAAGGHVVGGTTENPIFVSVIGAAPPPATTPFSIFADTPLIVGSDDTVFIIPDGETVHIQTLGVGNEDPTKGASVEVIYDDVGTERLIARFYTAGFTIFFSFADVSEARDGTALTGNALGTKTIIVRRAKFSGPNIAIDSVVRGYTV